MGRLAGWCALAVCFAVGCGLDVQGTGPTGAAPAQDDASVPSQNGGVGPSSSGAAGSGGMANGGGASSGSSIGDGGSAAPMGIEGGVAPDGGGGPTSNDGGPDAGNLCGPNGPVCPQGQMCDPVLGCVSCTMDSQCQASTPSCLSGSCVECRNDLDCINPSTPSCWPGNHTCQAACTSNQQCSQQDNGTPLCDPTTGACVGCVTSLDCQGQQLVCDPSTQRCVECASNLDCAGTPSTPACWRNRCSACATNADCSGATPYCSTGGDNGPRCVQCFQNAHCPASAPRCNGGMCGQSG